MSDSRHTACSCPGFSRAEVLRAGFARAGKGLPSIEPGMPIPAGTGLSRRSFLVRTAGLALSVYGAASLSPRAFEEGIAAAQAQGPAPVLVSVFLSGGIDSLSVLAPVGDPRYAQLRPTLALAPDGVNTFSEDTRLQWHPSAAPLKTLHEAGKVSVIPAIGYSSPNQSHFTSRHFWEVGELNESGRVGWLGRYLDVAGSPDNPLQGLALNSSLAPSLAPSNVPVAAVSQPESYSMQARDVWDNTIRAQLPQAFGALGRLNGGNGDLAAARLATRNTSSVYESLGPMRGTSPPWQTAVNYPSTSNSFPRRLAALAHMLSLGMPIRAVALNANGGYDTHSSQASTLPGDLALACQSLAAFQGDLEARGLADRVLVHVWSEFGRRPEENGGGTDHGAGGISLLIGNRARGTMVGEFPGLATLDNRGNLRSTVDFRAVYCSLLEQFLGVDAGPIIPGASGFARPDLVKPA